MKPTAATTLFVTITAFTSCKEYAYYQSPLHTNTAAYRSIPLKSDSNKSATYVNGTFLTGGANDHWRDGINGATGAIYRSHQFGSFDGYYGLTGTLGNYGIKRYDTTGYRNPRNQNYYYFNPNLDPVAINSGAGHKTFGAAGAIGGISFVMPLKRGSEWRAFQVEGNWQREFGDYLEFRQKLPDTAANIIFKNRNFLTISIGTEFVFKTRNGSIGFKNAIVTSTSNERDYFRPNEYYTRTPGYFSQTFQVTINRFTGFYQWNMGNSAGSVLIGLNCRIGR